MNSSRDRDQATTLANEPKERQVDANDVGELSILDEHLIPPTANPVGHQPAQNGDLESLADEFKLSLDEDLVDHPMLRRWP